MQVSLLTSEYQESHARYFANKDMLKWIIKCYCLSCTFSYPGHMWPVKVIKILNNLRQHIQSSTTVSRDSKIAQVIQLCHAHISVNKTCKHQQMRSFG